MLAPIFHPGVVSRAQARGLLAIPGVATPTEAFSALEFGASVLKVFPADVLGPGSFRAWRAVLPAGVQLFAVGGIDPDNLALYRQAGASSADLGSALHLHLHLVGEGGTHLNKPRRHMLPASAVARAGWHAVGFQVERAVDPGVDRAVERR